MKYLKYKYLLFILIVVVSSCSRFEEMNYNPNNPVSVPTSGLLTSAQSSLVFGLHGELSQLGMQYVQHFSQIRYTDKSNYADDGSSSFLSMYRNGLYDLQEIITLNEKEFTEEDAALSGDNENQIAVALILQSWAFQSITDVWGDIPYSEALKGNEGIITPVYDTQEAIYDGLIENLNNAVTMINTNPSINLQGDIIYDGDMIKWISFAQSLKLRIAMRLSEINSSKADELINDNDFSNAFSESGDFAHFIHLETENEANPLYADNYIDLGGDQFAVALPLMSAMQALNDPRIPVYADTATNTGTYIGLEYGLPGSSNEDDFSWPGDAYSGQTAPSILMTASEVLFIKAEAAQRGYISGDAAQFYYDAITVSMEYNGIDAGDIATYIAQTDVQYDASNWRELIGTQKWISLYNQGIQAWSEWRRLDYPVLVPGSGAALSEIPRRRAYPSDEYSTNNVNVTATVTNSLNGSDLMTGRVWWDQ